MNALMTMQYNDLKTMYDTVDHAVQALEYTVSYLRATGIEECLYASDIVSEQLAPLTDQRTALSDELCNRDWYVGFPRRRPAGCPDGWTESEVAWFDWERWLDSQLQGQMAYGVPGGSPTWPAWQWDAMLQEWAEASEICAEIMDQALDDGRWFPVSIQED